MSVLDGVVFDYKTSLKMAAQIFDLHDYRRTSCDPFFMVRRHENI
jgi:hypothetical protein